jgi:hypothetical protein
MINLDYAVTKEKADEVGGSM